MVILTDGSRAENAKQQAEAFTDHFAEAFGGKLQPVKQIAEESRRSLADKLVEIQSAPRDPGLIPSELELRRT